MVEKNVKLKDPDGTTYLYPQPCVATSSRIGGVKVGNTLTISGGILNYNLPTASTSTKGGIKIGRGFTMVNDTLKLALPITKDSISVDGDGGESATYTLPADVNMAILMVTYNDGNYVQVGNYNLNVGSTILMLRVGSTVTQLFINRGSKIGSSIHFLFDGAMDASADIDI